jgi:hypothetical protein
MSACLFCGGDADASDHDRVCDGRQGHVEAGDYERKPPLSQHPLFPLLAPWFRIVAYDRDGGHEHPRHRIDMTIPRVVGFRECVLAVVCGCAVCGREIHPVRERNERRRSLFVAVSCELDVKKGCARSAPSHAEYERIIELAEGREPGLPLVGGLKAPG